jgi:hypothetical protein
VSRSTGRRRRRSDQFDRSPNLSAAENFSSGARHSWTTAESQMQVFGNSNVIEYAATLTVKIEEDSASGVFRPSVQENKTKKRPTAKL